MKNIKKNVLLLAIVAFLAVPALSFAGGWISNGGNITDSLAGPGITGVALSANVQLYYDGDAGSGGDYFSMGSVNTSGTKAYMTNQASSKIYQSTAEKSATSDVTIAAAASSYSISTANWAALGD